MSVILEVSVPVEDFALGQALKADPAITIYLERVVPLERAIVPYFRVHDHDLESIEAALAQAGDIVGYEVVDSAGGEALVRVEWRNGTDSLVDAITRSGGSLLDAVGHEDVWELQIRFEDHEGLTAFYRTCTGEGISMTLRRMHNPGLPEHRGREFSLTEVQRETLLTAFEAGYFDIPRETTLVELADMLGVSDTAASQRLRRGITTLLLATLAEATADEGGEEEEVDKEFR